MTDGATGQTDWTVGHAHFVCCLCMCKSVCECVCARFVYAAPPRPTAPPSTRLAFLVFFCVICFSSFSQFVYITCRPPPPHCCPSAWQASRQLQSASKAAPTDMPRPYCSPAHRSTFWVNWSSVLLSCLALRFVGVDKRLCHACSGQRGGRGRGS